ncbi:MAG: DUF763 domain-containing protein [Candidatus Nanoarchaeia archaeon]
MRKTGITNLPLHYGTCPRWLFSRMTALGGAISEAIVYEYGQDELIKRISDPFFFQALSCVLGFDWHSSGTTTTTLGALKVALTDKELGVKVCGGKGNVSRKTPSEIEFNSEKLSLSSQKSSALIYASRMSAKVDNALIQDGYDLYAHFFIFSEDGKYAVIQQGMNSKIRYARRYHWLSGFDSFVEEPHNAICCDKKSGEVLDLTSKESNETRNISVDLVKDNPKHLEKDFDEVLHMTPNHYKLNLTRKSLAYLKKAYEFQPKNYEELVSIHGVGPSSIRALALISEIIYGTKLSWSDPAKFSFAHGGKDGVPYPVNRKVIDSNVEFLKEAVKNAKVGDKDRLNAIRRLAFFIK